MRVRSVRLAAAIEARRLMDQNMLEHKGPSTLEMLAMAVKKIKEAIVYVPSDTELRRMVLSSICKLHC